MKNEANNGTHGTEATMNDATLNGFRDLAEAMAGPAPRDWEWIGEHMSQRMFRITEERAKGYAERHGGVARQMEPLTEDHPSGLYYVDDYDEEPLGLDGEGLERQMEQEYDRGEDVYA